MNFDSFSFDRRLVSGINSCGYTTPTPIQVRAIPEVLKGKDVMGLAQTGTGKTAAFALPILQRLLDSNVPTQGPVRALVLAPTRELALQIHENFISLGKQTGIRSAAVFGGVGANPQIKAANKATVIVACPGRLIDLLNQGVLKLDKVDVLVLDEADRMLDMGFMPDIKKILSRLPATRQNLLFSATMPHDIRDLAGKILVNPATVQVDNTAPATRVVHEFYPVHPGLKASLLETLLDVTKYESVLIFTRTKHRAKNLARKLSFRGHESTFLQGNMSQNQRQRALDGFKDGTFKVMVATDIAARGIDCDRITHVINFDVPDTAETYTHRIGRTGRAGRAGVALSLVTTEDERLMREIEKIVGKSVDRRKVAEFDYDQPCKSQPGLERRGRVAAAPKRSYGSDKKRTSGDSRGRSGKPSGRPSGKFAGKASGKPSGRVKR